MRYVTAVEAEQLVKEGKGDQLNGGNWVGNTIAYPSMIMGDHSRKVCDGYIMHPNKVKKAKGKTVSKRYKMVVSEAKIGRIVDSEVMSAKHALKYMDYETIMSQKKRIQIQINHSRAILAILESNK
jgi:hypothetical protein